MRTSLIWTFISVLARLCQPGLTPQRLGTEWWWMQARTWPDKTQDLVVPVTTGSNRRQKPGGGGIRARKEFPPQHDVGFVIQYNQCVFFSFFFFSVLEENGGGHSTMESEIALQSRGQTAIKIHLARAGKAADQSRSEDDCSPDQDCSKNESHLHSRAHETLGLRNRQATFSLKPRFWWWIRIEKLWRRCCLTHYFSRPCLLQSTYSFGVV